MLLLAWKSEEQRYCINRVVYFLHVSDGTFQNTLAYIQLITNPPVKGLRLQICPISGLLSEKQIILELSSARRFPSGLFIFVFHSQLIVNKLFLFTLLGKLGPLLFLSRLIKFSKGLSLQEIQIDSWRWLIVDIFVIWLIIVWTEIRQHNQHWPRPWGRKTIVCLIRKLSIWIHSSVGPGLHPSPLARPDLNWSLYSISELGTSLFQICGQDYQPLMNLVMFSLIII